MKHLTSDNKGTGAILESPASHKVLHQSRPFVAESSAPYDWSKPLVTNYTQPIKNQDQAGKCGGALYSQFKQIYNTLVLGKPFAELSMNAFYSQQYAPSGGMTMQGMSEGAGFTATTTTTNCPDTVPCSEAQAESLTWETPSSLADCLLESGLQIVSVPIEINAMAAAIRDYKAIGVCLAGENNGTWLSANPMPPTKTQGDWGHFMCSTTEIPACAPGEEKLPFYQSWGLEVANGTGIQFFGPEYIDSGYIYDVFTFTKFVFKNNLQLGSTGTDVKYLQVKLGMSPKTLGFGIFGLKTLAAVKAYQTAHGIPNTGNVATLTLASLNK